MDLGSLQSLSAVPGYQEQRAALSNNSCRSYSHKSNSSYTMSLDEEQGGTLTPQEAPQYLELSPTPDRCRYS